MTVSQTEFRTAVLNADQPVPKGLVDGNTAPAGKRFDVYRNNVILSLIEAMRTAFPLVQKLLGPDTFDKLAGLYVRAHPPMSPLMMFYGEEFPDFLASFEPLAHIGYLADCARLDLAKRHAYHSADAATFDAAVLQRADITSQPLSLAPSTRVIRSPWPLFDLWRFNTEPNAPKPRAIPQDVLLTRPEYDPQVHELPAGGADWFLAVKGGKNFGQAYDATITDTPSFDLTAVLGLAVSSGALSNK